MAGKSKITSPDEFASTMQQLVAEAANATSAPADNVTRPGANPDAVRDGFAALTARLARLEALLGNSLDRFNAPNPAENDAIEQMQRMEEHLVALRGTESVNQRLFNSLHQELKNYRDNFLRESLQKPFIRDLVVLFDDLSSLGAQMDAASGNSLGGALAHWRGNLDNSIHSLVEILHRMEVNEIEPKEMVDLALHRVVSYEPADFPEDDGRIVMRIKRGFVWRDQVLRPEEVVAKRFS